MSNKHNLKVNCGGFFTQKSYTSMLCGLIMKRMLVPSSFRSSSCSGPWWHSQRPLLQWWSASLGTAVCQLWLHSTPNWIGNKQNWPVTTGWKWSGSLEFLSNQTLHYSFMRGQKLDQISTNVHTLKFNLHFQAFGSAWKSLVLVYCPKDIASFPVTLLISYL